MSLYDWLLFLHVLAAFAVVAAVVLYTYLTVSSRNLDRPSEVVRLFRISRVGDLLVNIGAFAALVLGIWLAIHVDGYEVWDGWVIAAIVLWLLFAETGRRVGKVYYGARDRAVQLVADGRDTASPELNAMLRSQVGLLLQLASIAIVHLLLIDMIWKPGT